MKGFFFLLDGEGCVGEYMFAERNDDSSYFVLFS